MLKFNYPFHLVTVSPWPLLVSLGVMLSMLGILEWFIEFSVSLMFMSNMYLMIVVFQWWRDVVRESTFQGMHTIKVCEGLYMGMILFILSELMFFVSFFWTYFNMYLSLSIELGLNSSYNLEVFNPYNIPLLNTMILLSSGVSITWCHYSILNEKYDMSLDGIKITILLGMIFSFFQFLEYKESYFSINDSIYGSIFFVATGFHGIHVLVGTMFIFINFIRLKNNHFSFVHHFGFEAASWYWHFVDIVWLFLYIFIYWLSY
uniref:Cytochrome c oxidase subunit 3 n=1 Tax=Capitonius sp. QL-2013 TaxID=1421593 RepID=A0A0A6ZKX9_9HYME|nr:cytochrome c oxidase subunit III [Capitonius sp. QL-2013]